MVIPEEPWTGLFHPGGGADTIRQYRDSVSLHMVNAAKSLIPKKKCHEIESPKIKEMDQWSGGDMEYFKYSGEEDMEGFKINGKIGRDLRRQGDLGPRGSTILRYVTWKIPS